MLEADEHNREAAKGIEQAEKLRKRSTEEDYYKVRWHPEEGLFLLPRAPLPPVVGVISPRGLV